MATAIEYGLIASLIAVVAVTAVNGISNSLSKQGPATSTDFTNAAKKLVKTRAVTTGSSTYVKSKQYFVRIDPPVNRCSQTIFFGPVRGNTVNLVTPAFSTTICNKGVG